MQSGSYHGDGRRAHAWGRVPSLQPAWFQARTCAESGPPSPTAPATAQGPRLAVRARALATGPPRSRSRPPWRLAGPCLLGALQSFLGEQGRPCLAGSTSSSCQALGRAEPPEFPVPHEEEGAVSKSVLKLVGCERGEEEASA